MKVAIYLRVAHPSIDISAQRVEVTEHCRRNGWTVVGEWSDVGSGMRVALPGLDSLLMECAASRVDSVVVSMIDRLGRSFRNMANIIERVDAMGVGVISVGENIDTKNTTGKFLVHTLGAFVKFQEGYNRERVLEGLRVARSRGSRLGRPSPGLVDVEARRRVVLRWRADGRPGGLRGLGRLLGGVSQTTAQRIERGFPDDSVVVVTDQLDEPQEV